MRIGIMFAAALSGMMLFGSQSSTLQAQAKGKKAQQPQQNSKREIELAIVGGEKVTLGNIEDAFKKNMNRREQAFEQLPIDSARDFLNLYINYRLKVSDAVSRGLLKDSAVINDIRQNRTALSTPYYFEKNITDKFVSTMAERRKEELKIAVILCAPRTNNSDTESAEKKAESCLKLLASGVDFAKVAKDSSDDAQTRENDGVLPWITSGQLLRELEDVVYSLKVGEYYKKTIPTRYGSFIVKLVARQPRIRLKGRHILIQGNPTGEDTTLVLKEARQKADSILALVRKGVSFEKLAVENSADKSSAQKGGELTNSYSRSLGFDGSRMQKLLPAFEDVLFSLKDGQVSEVIRTDYGFHIIRRDSTLKIDENFEKESVKKLYKQLYFERDKSAHIDSLKRVFGYGFNVLGLNEFLRAVDTTRTTADTNWKKNITSELRLKALYEIKNTSAAKEFSPEVMTIGAFVDTLSRRAELRGTALSRDGIERTMARIIDPKLMAVVTHDLELKFPEFAGLMKEFRDGILIFKVEDEEVWSRLKFDSSRARVFWEKQKENYKTARSFEFIEVNVISDTTAYRLLTEAKNGADIEEMAAKYTDRSGFREKKGKWPLAPGTSKLYAKVAEYKPKVGEFIGPIPENNGFSIIKVTNIEEPRVKSFEEAIPDFAPQFQDMVQKELTSQWIGRLRLKFPVSVNEKNFSNLFSKK